VNRGSLAGRSLERWRRQIGAGEVMPFTGSGFSCDAFDRDGRAIPSGEELRRELWSVCFPGEPIDQSSLADLFSHAHARFALRLRHFLERRLVVDPVTLPEHYALWLSRPWRRAYTSNTAAAIRTPTGRARGRCSSRPT
jgi:hypothetical protein